ncbi:MAG: NifB/NifX family molybdenum-iron cluster-binding protein [Deltaproteobacteria bacterium]|nr:NifB/NifX family molybdenum-iron cluster-binding protein [Deltaproteobacteria bacterium]MBW2661570.1 NifB/NifX family molybdenum-iron cluster-binding protein [Deltaproteobacteria bacterium]
MRIAVSADSPNLNAKVGFRFGASKYFIIIDLDTMDFEAIANPGASTYQGSGVHAVVLLISKKINTVLTGYCSPVAIGHLTVNGIQVLSGVKGTVEEVVQMHKKSKLQQQPGVESSLETSANKIDRATLVHAFKNSANQFIRLLPVLTGVVLLLGLFSSFMTKELLSSVFSGNIVEDTLLGASLGSIFAGNPISSYIIGGELLRYGISLFAVTALIVSWVTVGIVQLPAEMAALGKRFALVRNTVSFALALIIAILTVAFLTIIGV